MPLAAGGGALGGAARAALARLSQPCGRACGQVQAACRHRRSPRASRISCRLIGVQFADLDGEMSPLRVGEHRKREHGSMPEGIHRRQAVLFADQHGIVDALVLGVVQRRPSGSPPRRRRSAGIGRVPGQGLQQRDLAPAGLTPGRPEIEHQWVAVILATAMRWCRCCPATRASGQRSGSLGGRRRGLAIGPAAPVRERRGAGARAGAASARARC